MIQFCQKKMKTYIFAKLSAVLPSPFLWLMLPPHLIKIYSAVMAERSLVLHTSNVETSHHLQFNIHSEKLKGDGWSPGRQEERSAAVPAVQVKHGKLQVFSL